MLAPKGGKPLGLSAPLLFYDLLTHSKHPSALRRQNTAGRDGIGRGP